MTSPYLPLFPLVTALLVVVVARPINDIDAFWHVAVGREIVASRSLVGLGDEWAWYDPPEPWTTSQWLSELAMAGLVSTWGWGALVAVTVLLAVAALLLVAGVTLTRTSARSALVLVAITALFIALSAAPRAAMVSFVATVAVAHVSERTLTAGRLPGWWTVPAVVVWANVHGQWLIFPAALGLASILYWSEQPRGRRRFLGRALVRTAALLAAGVLTPLGVQGLVLSVNIGTAAGHLQEWQPSRPWGVVFLPLALVVAAIALGLWRQRTRPRLIVLLYVSVWILFSLPAVRNVVVSTMMLIPVAAAALGASRSATAAQDSARERRVLPLATLGTSLISLAIIGVALARIEPLTAAEPVAIAEHLHRDYTSVRVLNHYNTAGVLVAFGPPGIELGIDGRVERYGAEYIATYLDVFALEGDGWRPFLEEFQPDVAVVRWDSPIRHLLTDDWGWEVDVTDGDYVLLVPS